MEVWKDIKGYPGYQVSNKGNVRTLNKTTYTKKHGIRHWKDRLLKQKVNNSKTHTRKDYRVDLWKSGKPKTFLVARLVAFTFYEKDINDKSLTVNHIDKNSLNNNLDNLEIITLKENIQHEFRLGVSFQKKVKITNKITGTIIYPSSLNEGSEIINQYPGYLSAKIIKNIYENNKYKWELL